MPNWCSSTVNIIASKDSLDILESKINQATSSNKLNAGFGNEWLGNLLLFIGFSDDDVVNGKIRCRGSIDDVSRVSGEMLTLHTTSAWSPHIECIKVFVDHFVDDAEIYYTAEEPGCGLYWTNDDDIAGTIYMDWWYDGDQTECNRRILDLCRDCSDSPKEYVKEAISKLLSCNGSFEELSNKLIELAEDNGVFIDIGEYKYIEI